MIRRWLPWLLLIAAVGFHLLMLWNIAAHFQWQPNGRWGWEPVRHDVDRPAHWDRNAPPIGPFKTAPGHRFQQQLTRMKDTETAAKGLMFVPPRRTSNFGLDFWVRDANHTDPGGDFYQLYYGGLAARHGVSIFENDPDGFKPKLIKRLKTQTPFHPPNRYPPGFIYSIGVLLTMFTPWNAYLLWVIVHEIVLGFCIYQTVRICQPGTALIASAAWLGFLPWYLELYMGQTTFLIMAGTLALAMMFLNRMRPWAAGAWWAVTLITKPLTLLYVPLLLRMKKFKFTAWGLAVPVVSALVYFVFRLDDGRLFVQWTLGQDMVTSPGNFCLQNWLYRFHYSVQAVTLTSCGVIAAGLLFTWVFAPRHPVRVLLFWVTVYLLGYTHVWQHHQVLLLPAVIIPYGLTARKIFLAPWLLAALPSAFYWFEGHWNWTREVIYLSQGALPPLVLAALFLFVTLNEPSRG